MTNLLKRWYQGSMRHQILVWLLATNLFMLLLMAGAALQVSRNAVEKNIVEQLQREFLIESEIVESHLNGLVSEVRFLSRSPTVQLALKNPNQAPQLLDSALITHPLIRDDHDDFYLLDANLRDVYGTSSNIIPIKERRILAQKALAQHQMQSALVHTENGFFLLLAQPIESGGAIVLSQSINQIMSRFFQGNKEVAGWVLEDASGQALSSLYEGSAIDQKIAKEMLGDQNDTAESGNSYGSKATTGALAWKTIKGSLRLVDPLSNLHLQLVLNEKTNWTHIISVELILPFLLVVVLISLIVILVITQAGKSLASPLEDLASFALTVGESGFSSSVNPKKLRRLQDRQDEVGRLSIQFAKMLQRLRQGYAGLELKVEQRNAQLEAIFTLSPDGFIEIDSDGRVGYVNPAFEVLTGVMGADVVDQSLANLVEKLLQNIKGPTSASDIKRIFKASEEVQRITLEIPILRTLAVFTKANQSKNLVVYLRDITQEAELEELRSAFMTTAAHELRTPISSILGYAELLSRRLRARSAPNDEVILEMSSVIERQSKYMADLVNDLLDISRLEHQIARGFNLYKASLAGYLGPIVAHFQLHGDVREIVLYNDDHLPDIMLHAESFKRLILNLLTNAFKYSPKGSPVIVKTFTKKLNEILYVGVSIQDYGSGMSEQDLEHAFERFYRSNSNPDITGTGLGLSIVKEIMEAHSGQITIESKLDFGTTVTLLFPSVVKWHKT